MTRIDEYFKRLEPAKRRELERIRTLAKQLVPTAEETIAYGMPALTYKGRKFLGFDAHKNHIGIYPFSGRVFETLKAELEDYGWSKGALRVPLDRPIPERLLRDVIACRLRLIAEN